MTNTILKHTKITSLIPQKKPFVMVNRLYNFAEKTIEAGLVISSDNLFVENNVFTEPGLIEHMAQSVALHTGCDFYLRKEIPPTGYIGSVKNIAIYELPKVAEEIKTKVTILQEFMGVTLVDISVKLNDKKIACGQMKTVLPKVE